VLFMLFDLPMALVVIIVIGLIAGPWMALVPLVLFPLATALGLLRTVRLNRLVAASVAAGNRKTGMLVEAIEGAEPIKGLGAAWRFETRWAALVETNAVQSLQIKNLAEGAAYLAGSFQQLGYVALVALGAALTIEGSITLGAVIACSILSGRVLAPSSSIPGLLIQLAQARAALAGLEQVFALKSDNDGIERPIVPGVLHGQLRFEDVEFAYPGRTQVVTVKSLRIDAGEKVAVIGPVGAGKSTVLAMACGLIKPQRGTVYVDGIDAAQLSANWLGSNAAYTPQTPWLFSGTLRENLLMGQPDLGDEPIIDACRRTGLWSFVGQHPKGLELPIAEGGRGLSGGQRQLVCLTRHVLAGKPLWLLDEPTSGMDDALEAHSVALLRSLLTPRHTMLLVTHRPALLGLADRIVVLTQRGIALDGPRDQVLAQLAAPRKDAAPAAPALAA
jgi:ATP-binding cassette subfamily C protein LapB